MSFSGGGGKPSFPSTSAGDYRELPRVQSGGAPALRPGSIAPSPGREAALALASLAQRFPASSVLAREGARFSRVRLCATPETATQQAPLSLGFSRQEHWSGLPFPSPMHLSSRVAPGISWTQLSGLKGVNPPVKFGERTWDCSPGHAGKDGPHLVMTEGSCLGWEHPLEEEMATHSRVLAWRIPGIGDLGIWASGRKTPGPDSRIISREQ